MPDSNSQAIQHADFLAGGGEMGERMRAYDWNATPLGAPTAWPTLLKTALRILLTSQQPMLIWWGPQLIQFYNDAYRETMGPERHPSALGQRARECWDETWHITGPEIEHVMSGQGAVWREDILVPVTRHGRREQTWWNYGYSPLEDESGIVGVFVTCNDVTDAHRNKQRLEEINHGLAREVELHKQTHTELRADRDRIDAERGKFQGDLAQQVRDWSRLHEMSNRLLQTDTLRDQFQIVLDTVTAFHGCIQGVISLYDPRKKGLVTQASRGISENGLCQLALVAVGAGACGLSFLEKRRIIIADTETDPIYEEYRGYARQEGFRGLYSTPILSASGEAMGVLSVYFSTPRPPTERELRLTDICTGQLALFVERYRTDMKLHREQRRSHQLLNSMKDGFIWMDSAFRIARINAEGLRLDGRSAEDIVGKTHWDAWPGTEDMLHGITYKQVMKDRKARRFESCFEYGGRHICLDFHAYPEGDGVAVLYRDVTEKKLAEKALADVVAESERGRRLYETVLDNSPDLAYVFDLNHRFIYANAVLLEMWGRSWDEAIGKNCLELGYEPWHAEMHGEEIEQVKRTKQSIRGEVPFNGTFGRRIYEYILVPVIGPDGDVEAVAGTTRDVTERKQTEESLREANRRKDEFLAMLAHELRNPLAPIATAAHILKIAGEDKHKVRQSSDIIARQVKHMTMLVDDLLDVSRVTRGLVKLEKEPVDIKQVVSSAIEQARPLIEARDHTMSTHVDGSHAMVLGDKTRLVQVITNLLNNAAKYTPHGGTIALDVRSDGTWAKVSVTDNGIGIDRALLPHLFDLFTQAERTPDRSQGGLGLGLALVKSIMELHGGRVEGHSQGAGKGSCFTVRVPLISQSQAAQGQLAPGAGLRTGQRKLRVLIVDDNEDAAASLGTLLETEGHEIMVEIDPRAALKTAQERSPEVCILDIGLPGMNGYELAEKLQANPATRDALLIALTGYGQTHDKVLTRAAGFAHHFVKPLDMQRLDTVLRQLAEADPVASG